VVDVERLRHFLTSLIPPRAQVVAEAPGWSVFTPGLPPPDGAEQSDYRDQHGGAGRPGDLAS